MVEMDSVSSENTKKLDSGKIFEKLKIKTWILILKFETFIDDVKLIKKFNKLS